jgi:uncharacterized membrane protein
MSTRLTTLIVLVLLAASLTAGLLLWNRLPDPMASHWNIYDEVDGYTSRFWGVFLMPLVSLGLFALFMVIPRIDPLKANIAQFREAFNLLILLLVLFLGYIWKLSLLWNLGFTGFRMSTAMLPAMGLLYMYIGVLLRKAKRNWFIGIRTPWTLSSDQVWQETHRLGSVLFFACGVLALAGALFGPYAVWFVLLPVVGVALFLIVYSYILYNRETRS